MNVSRETQHRLGIYADLLKRWNSRINLVSPATLQDFEVRHLADSLQLSELVQECSGGWVDLGSGGGLPGVVLAIAKADTDICFSLVESDRRKAAFLQTAIRETGLKNCTVQPKRIEALPPLNAAYVSARALAPLRQIMAYLDLHMAPAGKAFLMKGRRWQSELDDARQLWRFDCVAHPSRTEQGAAILEISGVVHGAS